MTNPTYYVKDGHTLGYVDPRQPQWFWPVGCMIKMFSHSPNAGPIAYDPSIDKLVPATKADFDRFRVVPPPGLFKTIGEALEEAYPFGYRSEDKEP